LSAGSRLALRYLELNLTSDNAPNYHSQRWDEAKSVPERSSDLRNRKRNSYYHYAALVAKREGKPYTVCFPDFQTGHEEMCVIEAAIESSKSGKSVKVPS
jgi:hypothetical protein